MAYAIYSEHPDSAGRKKQDFTAWSIWADQNAPWAGVGVPQMASLLEPVCGRPEGASACSVLDQGGILLPEDVRLVNRLAQGRMSEKVRAVFTHAAEHGYPVRVVFSKGFGAISASAHLAKSTSD